MYILSQQVKKVLIEEVDPIIYKNVIRYFLSFEYSFIVVSIMIISNFSSLEILISYISALLLRHIYNKFLYNKFYHKLTDKAKHDNIYNK